MEWPRPGTVSTKGARGHFCEKPERSGSFNEGAGVSMKSVHRHHWLKKAIKLVTYGDGRLSQIELSVIAILLGPRRKPFRPSSRYPTSRPRRRVESNSRARAVL